MSLKSPANPPYLVEPQYAKGFYEGDQIWFELQLSDAVTQQRPSGIFRKGVGYRPASDMAATLLAGKICYDTTILRTTSLGLVACYRLGLAVAFGGYATGINLEG